MLRLILNNIKLITNKKSFILMGVLAPAIIIMIFSFAFGNDTIYKVGVINKDNKYISTQIIDSIKNIENIHIEEINEENYELLLITHQLQLVVRFDDDFTDEILAGNNQNVSIKSISESDVTSTIISIIKSKTEDISILAKASNYDLNKLIKLNEEYNEKGLKISTNVIEKNRPQVKNSIGIVIMMIFITGANISNFLIEDDENNTKNRILGSGISLSKYYFSMMIVFYLLSSATSIIYYILCKIFKLDFGMINTNNFLVVLLMINLVSVCLNLFIVSLTKSRYIASTMNILIVVPTCMISGVFWEFDVMPTYLKSIGNYLPQRWVYICLENLQKYDDIGSIILYLGAMIILSLIFFILSIRSNLLRKN